jgi:hypothetical protein
LTSMIQDNADIGERHGLCERGYSSDLRRFVQHYRSHTLDASLLLLPLVDILLFNDAGLLGQDNAVSSRSLIGNFPQALTYLGLTNTALFLSGPAIWRAAG